MLLSFDAGARAITQPLRPLKSLKPLRPVGQVRRMRAAETARDPTAATPRTDESLRLAALELFVERGFHGTSMREIALRAGTSVSHLYYYHPSKDDLLEAMMVGIVDDLLGLLGEALAAAGDDPGDRLRAVVEAQVRFHCERRAEAFVGRSELRSLDAEKRSHVVARYDRVTALFRGVIDDGVRQGRFDCADRKEATSAVLSMCNGVSTWYSRSGRLTPTTIAERYAALVLRMVGERGLRVRSSTPRHASTPT